MNLFNALRRLIDRRPGESAEDTSTPEAAQDRHDREAARKYWEGQVAADRTRRGPREGRP